MIDPVFYNLETIILGNTWDPSVFEVLVDGETQDLSNCVLTMVIHSKGDKNSVIDTLTDGNGLVINRTNGLVGIMRTHTEVDAKFVVGEYAWYLKVENGSQIDRYVEGCVEVRE